MAYDIINLISATGFCNFYLVPARPLQTNLSHFSLVNDNTLFPVESNLPAAVPLWWFMLKVDERYALGCPGAIMKQYTGGLVFQK